MESWGGRLLIAKILLNGVPATCEPLGRHNKLIFAGGLLSDTNVTTTGQISVGGKSPLTGGVKESNTGGQAGKKLARLGIRAIVIEDIPLKLGTNVLIVQSKKINLETFPELNRKTVSETMKLLQDRYGKEIGVFCIGPAGEMLMYGAGIASPDNKIMQIRYAARGGLGALMGSKGLKAIVIDDTGSDYRPQYHDKKLLTETNKELIEALMNDPKTENRHVYGTSAILALANTVGLLPTRNFSSGQFEKADKISGEQVRKIIKTRGGVGRSGTSYVPGCVIQCCNVFPDKSGRKAVASIQYETIALLGSNCGISNLDDIAELNHLCNEVGVDTIETGAAIGVVMESGMFKFGDADSAKSLIKSIGDGALLGRIVGNGAYITGRILGVRRVPVIKKQAIPGYDPRALKGNGVTYVTSPMGADHTAGNAFETLKTTDPLGIDEQVENSRRLQIRAAILDTLGLCLFVRPPFVKKPDMFVSLLNGRFGWDYTLENVINIGIEVLDTERAFNQGAGVSENFYSIPEFMQNEALPPTNAIYNIPLQKMKNIWDIKPSKDRF